MYDGRTAAIDRKATDNTVYEYGVNTGNLVCADSP